MVMSLPPLELVMPVFLYDVLAPSIVAAALVLMVQAFLPRGLASDAGAVFGILIAFCVGNYFQHAVAFQLESGSTLTWSSWWSALRASFLGAIEGQNPPPAARYWLPWSVALVTLLGLTVRWPTIPPDLAAIFRTGVSAGVAYLLTPRGLREDHAWLWPTLAGVFAVGWQTLDRLGKSAPGGWLPALASLLFVLGGMVVLHAHSARLTDAAMIASGAWFGLAAVAWLSKSDMSAAAPVLAIGLPSLMLTAHNDTYSEVPATAFALVGLAPLGLVLALLAPSDNRSSWRFVLVAWLLALTPAIIGLAMAIKAESLSFE
jgi:VanZ family protein